MSNGQSLTDCLADFERDSPQAGNPSTLKLGTDRLSRVQRLLERLARFPQAGSTAAGHPPTRPAPGPTAARARRRLALRAAGANGQPSESSSLARGSLDVRHTRALLFRRRLALSDGNGSRRMPQHRNRNDANDRNRPHQPTRLLDPAFSTLCRLRAGLCSYHFTQGQGEQGRGIRIAECLVARPNPAANLVKASRPAPVFFT